MSIQSRRDQEVQDLKNRILDTAIKLASDKGWSNVSIRKISAQIHYSTMVVYSLFGSKDILFGELRKWGFSKYLKYLEATDLNTKQPKDAILAITNQTVQFYLENKELYKIMFGVVGIQGLKNECTAGSTSTEVAIIIKKYLHAALKGNEDSLFFNWWIIIHGCISIGYSMEDDEFQKILPLLDDALKRFLTE